MLKISTKLTLWYLLATAVVIVTTAFSMYYIFDQQRRTSIDEDLADFAEFLTTGLGAQSTDLSDIFNEMLARKEKPNYKQRPHNRFLLSSNDSIIFESNLTTNLDSLLNALEERKEFSFTAKYNTIKLNNQDYRIYTKPIRLKPKKDYDLLVFTSMERHYESLEQLRTILIFVIPMSLILSGIIGFFIAHRAFSPVRAITETAASITSRNLDKRVPVSSTEDEISNLAKTVNDMIGRLNDTFISQQRFIADASHDLRTPLTVVQMELELLLSKPNLDSDTRFIVDRCLKEVFRLNELAENLMLLARADANQLTVNKRLYRIDEQLMECISQLKNLAQSRQITFRPEISESVEIFADEAMLRRMLINAFDNAIKYSHTGQTIITNLSLVNSKVIITIRNYGEFIDSKHLDRIFDRFQRGDISRTSKGFGLGLAIIKAIAKVHRGDVTMESSEKDGTVLTILLPQKDDA